MRYLAVVCFLLAIAFPFNVNAEQAELCTFTKVSDGELSSAAPGGQIKRMTSLGADSGNSAEVDFNCSLPAKLVIAVSQIEGDNLDPAFIRAIATNRTTGLSTKSGESSIDLGAGTTRVSIDLVVDKPSPLVAGKYKFIVQMTFS